MSWWEGLIAAISIALAIAIFVIGDDEPFWVRLGEAMLVGLLWLPALFLFAVMMISDGIVALIRRVRRP